MLRSDVLNLQFSFSTVVTRYITIKTKLAAVSQIEYHSSGEKNFLIVFSSLENL